MNTEQPCAHWLLVSYLDQINMRKSQCKLIDISWPVSWVNIKSYIMAMFKQRDICNYNVLTAV